MQWTNYDSRKFAWLGDRAYNIHSQSGEDGLLAAIFEKIGVANKWCLEVGAADGLFFSNTRQLIKDGWQAILIEANDGQFERLLKISDPEGGAIATKLPHGEGVRYTTPRFTLWHCKASHEGETSLDAILKASYAPTDIDLLVIDVDGQDYYLFNSLARYRPRVIVCEYDQNADPMEIPELGGPGMAGDMAIIHVANARGYMPVCKTPYNLIFVRHDLVDLVAGPIDEEATRAFYEKWATETNAFLSNARGVVHIGANTGQERDIYQSLDLPVIWVEALPAEFGELVNNISDYPRQRAYQALLTDEDGKEYNFSVANNGGQSSSIYDFADHKQIWPEVGYVGSVSLMSLTFKTLTAASGWDLAAYDTLIMDVQGAELLVLKGMGDLLDGFKYIRAESADFEIYKDCCQLKDLDDYLIPRGFTRVQTWRAAGKPDLGYTYEALYARDGAEVVAPKHKEDGMVRLCAVMSTPRIGFLSTMDCVFSVMAGLSGSFVRTEGVFWNQSLTRGIEDAIKKGANYILTIDFDSLFNVDDVKRLVCHLYDNPDVDIVVPIQMKREGGEPLMSTDGEVDLRQSLIPIRQGHFGLTMFRASLFDKIAKPWLREVPDESGSWNEGRLDPDMFFWQNCRENGVKVTAALDVVIGHLEQVVTWPAQDFKPLHQTINDWRKIGKPTSAFIKPPSSAMPQAAAMTMKG
jgi:FkbM family methyltransferase